MLASQIIRSLPESLKWMVLFDLVPVDETDCLAVGEMPPFLPVLLQLRAEAEHGEARAVFFEEPLARCSPVERDPDILKERAEEAHPRYGWQDHTEYVQNFTLPQYVGGSPRA